ncbi:MAG: recombinase family protein [Bacteroidales bacterium]|nr:recombinase family protein [Bacteroidales bacterium]
MNVILYCRVSTDEQADGCSLDVQEKYLRAYCSNHGYCVAGLYREDCSAKHYDLKRPEFKKIYDYCKKNRGTIDKILFLRWDRYSRNVEFAFAYKRRLYDDLGIEINSIESPIDFNGTEWSMLLAMYCGAAHTEDVKISKRTKDGIHGTLLKGKCSNRAPRGYKNFRADKHNCWVEIDKETGPVVKQVFYEVAKGLETPSSIRRRLMPGLADSSLYDMLRNRFYCREGYVPAYGEDTEQYVVGVHEPLVDRETFEKVQDMIGGKKKQAPKLTAKTAKPELFLRKFLVCPICGHRLSGYRANGNGGTYSYYTCSNDHKHGNFKAETTNDAFFKYVSCLKPNQGVLALYNEVLLDVRGDAVRARKSSADKQQEEVNKIEKRIQVVYDRYIDGEITASEKQELISRYEKQKRQIETQIKALKMSSELRIKDKLEYSLNIIGNLNEFFRLASVDVKIKLLGSIFPEKIYFGGKIIEPTSSIKCLI